MTKRVTLRGSARAGAVGRASRAQRRERARKAAARRAENMEAKRGEREAEFSDKMARGIIAPVAFRQSFIVCHRESWMAVPTKKRPEGPLEGLAEGRLE